MAKISLILVAVFLLISTLLFTGCSSASTVTVTGPTTTVTSTSQASPVTTTAISTTTATVTVTATSTITVTSVPTTPTRNPFQGAMSGSWSGTEIVSPPSVSGSFAITIDMKGNVQGTFNGSYTGTIAGQVDVNGNLTATGTATISGYSEVLTWKGNLSVIGNSLNGLGTWSDPYGSGTFSATGISSQ